MSKLSLLQLSRLRTLRLRANDISPELDNYVRMAIRGLYCSATEFSVTDRDKYIETLRKILTLIEKEPLI